MKSKLGITVGLFGAGIYAANLIGGIFVSIILLGYVLMFEENEWLKITAIKATVLIVVFELLDRTIKLLSSLNIVMDNFLEVFGGQFRIIFVTRLTMFLSSALFFAQLIIFLILIVKAINQGTIKIPFVDELIEKHYKEIQ